MKTVAISLTQTERRHAHGIYRYWVARWTDDTGRRRSRNLGRADRGAPRRLSKRAAGVKARELEMELARSPRQRNQPATMGLGEFLRRYLADRTGELGRGTWALHAKTGAYLAGFFGDRRRLDSIRRDEARAFKSALADGALNHLSKRKAPRPMQAATVDLHIRNARTLFNRALADDLVDLNPFDRLSATVPVPRDWHYVSGEEFDRLLEAEGRPAWRLLLALARWAALRRGEALHLGWRHIDWSTRRIEIISQADFTLKDKEPRIVPLPPRLHDLLLAAFLAAAPGQDYVIGPSSVRVNNFSRDFGVLCHRAGVERYPKPLHTLRKSCITDWAAVHPLHVVRVWAGHSDIATTDRHYLQVSAAEYERAAGLSAETDASGTTFGTTPAVCPANRRGGEGGSPC